MRQGTGQAADYRVYGPDFQEELVWFCNIRVYPNVAYPRRGKTRQSAPDVGARRLGQDEQYLTVRESCPRRARSQMACYHASGAIFTGLGVQYYGLKAVTSIRLLRRP